ncbi:MULTISPECIES: PEPxxWA-CTERM sorting domain-containing protein [Sphingomonas]|uniref:PEPxxWA-CTERM sorting domain-containing protein n=1 Tax=Sphingomonas TaxID=13687 RepID=UPI000A4B5BD9|nr:MULTISPECIES: PEPxxWA-CTERM sorting domain-containing protein [Sphingomonas]MCW6532019.1 PEPxxWA-CTERM sorting domain-containing protein [Sphingomonas lycopersici]
MNIKGAGATALALAAVVAIPQAYAAPVIAGGFTLDTGTFGAQTGVHFQNQINSTTVGGVVNQDGSSVTFTSTDAITGGGGGGEATISGTMTNLTVDFAKAWDNLTFAFSNDTAFTFNMWVNGVELFTSGGNCSVICSAKKNANNQFTLSGTGIQSVSFTFDPQIATAKQFRVEGLSQIGGGVPEPATWALMILGFGAIGGTLRVRNRRLRYAH